MSDWAQLAARTVALLRELVRRDSSNPPGDTVAVADHLERVLQTAGIESTRIDMGRGRANLVARVRGDGSRRPLLFLTHLDVVPAGGGWTHPPFAGDIADGHVWGRGTLDMKHIVAAVTIALAEAVRREMPLRRDAVFVATADEEIAGETGAARLFREHPELVDCELAVSEGGDSLRYGEHRYLLVEAAEKGWGTLELRRTAPPGHSSLPTNENPLLELGGILQRLSSARFPHRVIPVVRRLIEGIAADQPPTERTTLLALLDADAAPAALRALDCDVVTRHQLEGMLFSHATPTFAGGGENLFTIPSEARLTLAARLLPGETRESWLYDLEAIVGPLGDHATGPFHPGVTLGDGPLYPVLERIAARHNPGMRILPTLMLGGGDVRHAAHAGAEAYGYFPLPLARHGESIWELAHACDERIRLEHVDLCLRYAWDLLCEVNDLADWRSPQLII